MAPQPQFEFIDYSGAASGKSRVNPEARRRARVVVMQDYLHKSRSLQQANAKPESLGLLKERTTKFRLRPAKNQRRPADHSKQEDLSYRIPRSSALIDQLYLAIDTSSHATRALIDYYMHSYWTNSLAVNPRGQWTLMTLADPAMVHAKLSLVALHRADRREGGLSPEHIYHRGQAIALINERLSDKSATISESSIGAIALLVSLDDHSQWSEASKDTHLLAIAAAVQQRGGIDSPSICEPLRRVLIWVDLFHATMSEQKPRLRSKAAASVAPPPATRGISLAYRQHQERHLVPQVSALTHLYKLLEDLSTLLHTKAILNRRSAPAERTAFSDALYTFETSLSHVPSLQLLDSDHRDPWSFTDSLRAFRDAALICSYTQLREQNSLFIFSRLARRLQAYVTPLLDASRADKDLFDLLAGVQVLVWVLLMGWKASVMARGDGRWFSVRALETALRYGVATRLFEVSDLGEARTNLVLETRDDEMCFLGLDAADMDRLRLEMKGWVDLANSQGQ